MVRKPNREVACAECGKTFKAHRSDAQYCSRDCWLNQLRRKHGGDPYRGAKRRWAAANPDLVREIKQRSDDKHGERWRAAKRQRYAESAEDQRAQQRERYRTQDDEKREKRKEYARRYNNRNRAKVRAADLRRMHGVAEWESLFASLMEAQDGKCYLCGDALRPHVSRAVHLDHDHSCCPTATSCENCRRGLACHACNVLIGRAKDDPARLRRIADNLERANALVRRRRDGALF